MRILILTARFPPLAYGGHAERCRQMVSALVRHGNAVQVLTSNHRLPAQSLSGESGVRRRLILADDANGDFGSLCRRERVNYDTLLDSLAGFRPDCAFVWDMRGLSKSLLHHLRTHGIPCLHDIHNAWPVEDVAADPWYRWWHGRAGVSRKCYRALLYVSGRARALKRKFPPLDTAAIDFSQAYVCSRRLRDDLVENGFGDPAPEVVYPSTDGNLLPIKIGYQSHTRFIWAGRLSEEKDPWTAVSAVRLLRERGVPASLHMFVQGEQVERKRMREQIDTAGMRDYVFKKYIRPSELPRHLVGYDALLSTNWSSDPFPMTPLEAMLAGVPCILSRGSAAQEIVTEDEHFIGFDAGDSESLADAMEKFCQKPDFGAEMARKCREELQERCFMDNHIKTILKRLEDAVHAS